MTLNTFGKNRIWNHQKQETKKQWQERQEEELNLSLFLISFISGLTMKSIYILVTFYQLTNLAILVFNPYE